MPILTLLLVAIVQGITEFLPISSSGHLILLPALTGMDDQGLAIDVAAHLGTLAAVILFFWRDVRIAVMGLGNLARGRIEERGDFLAFCLIVATVPAVIMGLFIKALDLDETMRSVALIGWTTLIFGLVLYWADRTRPTTRRAEEWTLRHAVIMGLWQALALIPGTSRSGITITGGRALGYAREDAARLAMLMSIPTILASGLVLSLDVIGQADWALARDAGIAALFSGIAALFALKLMFRLLRSVSFTPYVIYRVALGLGLLAYAYL